MFGKSIIYSLVTVLIGATTVFAQYTKQSYIEEYKEIAVKEMLRCGIPASITLAQGILESSFGNSELSRRSNNHFGIKCHSDWGGKKVYHDDDEKQECFRKYRKAEESFIDHSDFLLGRSRYAFLFKLRPTDYKGWAHGLKKAGYATNPKYPKLLITIIEEHDLSKYDKAYNVRKVKPKNDLQVEAESEIFQFNRINAVLAKDDDTYEKIALKHHLTLARILKYNDLERARPLKNGEKVYIQPKRNSGQVKFHQIKEWETMYDVSQKYGIKLSKLYDRNLLEPGQEPQGGTRVFLKGKRTLSVKLREEKKPQTTPKSDQHYTVKQGDTLYSISRKFGVTVEELKKINNLSSNNLEIGDKLIVKK